MAYTPSLEDIDNIGYKPSLEDLPPIQEPTVQKLSSMAESQALPSETRRRPQMQEEFSNPMLSQGFNQLPQEEKLKRISMSQFDPANLSPMGTYVPSGTYESEGARLLNSALLAAAQPEMAAGKGIASRYIINPLANLISRIGTGTATNVAYQAPDIKSGQDLSEALEKGLTSNALLEGITLPFRGAAHLGEIFNPEKFTQQKAGQIMNEVSQTKNKMNEMYSPVNEKYNDFNVTVTPKEYLKSAGVTKNKLFPDAKIIYDDFINKPTFYNLHKLQSKLGEDWARISQHPATYEKSQLFSGMRDKLQEKVQNFLKRDENALNQYNSASDYAKNNYFPYLATPTLRKISQGKIDVNPNSLSRSIQKGLEKTVGKEQKNVIPESHPLRNHLNDLNKMINFGKAAQTLVPTITGAIAGESLYPGAGGILGGALGGATGAGISKFASPAIASLSQNPLLQRTFKNISPLYYAGGRMAGNILSNQE